MDFAAQHLHTGLGAMSALLNMLQLRAAPALRGVCPVEPVSLL